MAAYAALVSLTNIVDQIQNHPRISTSLDSNQIESLRENADFLLDFIESNHSHGGGSEEAEILETEIASAAHAAEDVIESHIVDQIHSGSISLLDLQTVIEDMDSVKDKVANFREKRGLFKDHKDGSTHSMSAPLITSSGKNKMVGFDEELIQLMDELTGRGRNLQIITIVGMGGIGKTTLTRNVYEKSLILRHFDVRAWATISQEYSARAILLELLYCQSKSSEQLDQKAEHRLGEQLRKSLFNRRYLIVLDDLWSIEAWDEIKFFFPDNNNGSRIIITTRLSNVAVHFGSSCLLMKLLDEDKSWKLFCEKAFSPEGCPLELVEIGKKIAEKCKGLPLLITVTGALLGKSSRTQEYWEIISKDINSVLDVGHDEQSVDILSLSYRHLPVHLKPCFLYMGIFLEDREIYVSQLVKLWVAEGFIKPNKTQSLEEVAEGYIKDLVDRNLIFVRRFRLNGKVRTCYIHDLLRDLCLKAARKEKFLYVMRVSEIPARTVDKERRFVLKERIAEKYLSEVFDALESASLTRSLISKGGQLSFKLRLLRVLNVVDSDFLDTTFKQVNLRYIRLRYFERFAFIPRELPQSISLLWNLQT